MIGTHFSKNSSHNGYDGGNYFGIFGISGYTLGLITRFGFHYGPNGFSLKFNLPAPYSQVLNYYENYDNIVNRGWSKSKGDCWNQYVSHTFNFNEDVYFDLVFDASKNEEALYIDRYQESQSKYR